MVDQTAYADRYSFSATAGQQIAISLSSTAFDTYLALIGPNGSVLTVNDDGGDGTNSRIPPDLGFFTLPSAGTYVIEASSYRSNITGGYTLTLSGPATSGGAVIIDGTDANEHGSASGGQNQNGWLYMQKALENLAGQVPAGTAKVVVDLGTTSSTARAAIDSAFNLSLLPANGWTLTHVDGAAAIGAWLTNLSTANTGILYVPSYNNTPGGLDPGEMTAINTHATEIANFVNRAGDPSRGGALFAMGESNTSTNLGAWGWLQALFPGLLVTDVGTGGIGTNITLTPDGANAFPGLTNTALAGADPWHNYFTGNLGTLKVLGTAPDSAGVTRQIILGGTGILVPRANLAITEAASPNPVVAGSNLT